MKSELIGKWAFIIGLLIALIAGVVQAYVSEMMLVLFILGLIVGFLNISEKTSQKFLIAVIALMIMGVASIGVLSVFGAAISTYISAVLGNFISFVGAAALVVAIKTALEVSKK